MELRVYNTDLSLTAVREDIETLTAREEYCGAGEFSLVLREGGVNIGDFLQIPGTKSGYAVTAIREEADGRTTVTGREILWLFNRAVISTMQTTAGRASDVLASLANTGRDVLPVWLNLLVPTGTQQIEVTVGRCTLLEAMCSTAAVGDVGLKFYFSPAHGDTVGTMTFSARKKQTAERFLSVSLGNIATLTRYRDESHYANYAYVEGADGTVVTVDNRGTEAKKAVYVNANDISPSRYGSDYTNALTRRGESVLASRRRVQKVTVTTDENLAVGTVIELRSPLVSGTALCTARTVTYTGGKTTVRTELEVTENEEQNKTERKQLTNNGKIISL